MNSNFLKELHKENSRFMNKAMFVIQAITIPLVVYIIFNLPDLFFATKICLFLTVVFFLISVATLLGSFFISENSIEALENEKVENSIKLQQWVKLMNMCAALCIGYGFITIIISIMTLL